MKVSVIIPVFQAEAYLRKCLDSVLAQTCQDLEILLMDDGSTDGSGVICQAYAAKYPNVHTVRFNHCGPGRARSEGLRHATGEYIVFADADDYFCANDGIQKMTDLLEKTDADVAVGNYCRLWDGRILETAKHSAFSGMDRENGKFRFCGFFSVGTLSYVWGKAYRHSFLRKHGLSFGDYEYAEDKFFNFQCYARGARYAFLDDVVYAYRKNDASLSHGQHGDRSRCWLRIASDLQRYLEDEKQSGAYGDLVAYTVNFAAFFDGKDRYCSSGKKQEAIKDLLRSYGSDPVADRCFGQMARGRFLDGVSGLGWKIMMWTFAFFMRIKALNILSLGIKLLVDWKIDEQLSDTGRKRSK